nr:hypothetical protein [Tanacetum cinerariifolium]
MFIPSDSTVQKLQTTEDLQGDALLHYDAEIEVMNLILLSIPNDIYNYVDAYTSAKDMWKELNDDIQTNYEDPLTSAMLLLARAITQNFYNPTNNRLRTSSNTRNQAIIQEKVVEGSNETENVQRALRTPSLGNTSTVQCYNCSGKGHYARNCPKPRVWDSKYFMEQMWLAKQDEAGVILTDEQNDFFFADASRIKDGGNGSIRVVFPLVRLVSCSWGFKSSRLCFLDFFNDSRIFLEQSIAAIKGYRGGSGG